MRDEINGLSSQLVEEVPSEIEDVDTAFDDESKRWFARELYSLKLECEKGMYQIIRPYPKFGFQTTLITRHTQVNFGIH